jgi:hypothetical protein
MENASMEARRIGIDFVFIKLRIFHFYKETPLSFWIPALRNGGILRHPS